MTTGTHQSYTRWKLYQAGSPYGWLPFYFFPKSSEWVWDFFILQPLYNNLQLPPKLQRHLGGLQIPPGLPTLDLLALPSGISQHASSTLSPVCTSSDRWFCPHPTGGKLSLDPLLRLLPLLLQLPHILSCALHSDVLCSGTSHSTIIISTFGETTGNS